MVIMYCFKHYKSVTASVLRGFMQYTIGRKILKKCCSILFLVLGSFQKCKLCMFTLKLEILSQSYTLSSHLPKSAQWIKSYNPSTTQFLGVASKRPSSFVYCQ